MYDKLDKVGIKPKINIMDNKASLHVCIIITNTLKPLYQKVAPHCHQANAVEKAIQTAKHISFLARLPLILIFPNTNG